MNGVGAHSVSDWSGGVYNVRRLAAGKHGGLCHLCSARETLFEEQATGTDVRSVPPFHKEQSRC